MPADAAPAVETEWIPVSETRGVRILRLNRPAKYNAINTRVLAELDDQLNIADNATGAIVLTGSGKAFGAGADIAEYVAADLAGFREFTRRANEVCRRICEIPVPVIAAVNGVALGGAFEIVLCCDLVVAAEDAQFGLPELSLGLIPGWGGTQRLTTVIGPGRAKHAIMTGTRITAQEAATLGIAQLVCPNVELLARAVALATDLARGPAQAIAAAKAAVNASHPDGTGHQVEETMLGQLFTTRDGAEGIRAFVEKRAPRFGQE